MGRPISLFSNYHKEENTITNYCGLVLKLLYEENPRSFEAALVNLIGENNHLIIGPSFTQQTKKTENTPDLEITQQSLSILFETKLYDWFYDKQIQNHINSFNPHAELKILFLLCNFEQENYEVRFEKGIQAAKEKGVVFQPISFEDFIEALKSVRSSETFKSTIEEFSQFLDSNGNLPRWKNLLDVINCRNTMHEINENVYMCPNFTGSYTHRRAKYFGPYSNKNVDRVFEIKAMVTVTNLDEKAKVEWNNTSMDENILEQEAKEKIRLFPSRVQELTSFGLKVFLLEKPFLANFRKTSYGGLQGSKRYFEIKDIDVKDSESLANVLQYKTWETF